MRVRDNLSHWVSCGGINYCAKGKLKGCYYLSKFSIASSKHDFFGLINRVNIFIRFAFMIFEVEHAKPVGWIGLIRYLLIMMSWCVCVCTIPANYDVLVCARVRVC